MNVNDNKLGTSSLEFRSANFILLEQNLLFVIESSKVRLWSCISCCLLSDAIISFDADVAVKILKDFRTSENIDQC